MSVRVPRVEAPTAMPLLKAALLCAALFLVLASSANAQYGGTFVATVPQASTAEASDWNPPIVPPDGATLIIPQGTTILSVDSDLHLGSLRVDHQGDAPIIRLTGESRLSIGIVDGIPLELRNPTIMGTAGKDNRVSFPSGVSISGTLRLGNGVTLDVDTANGLGGLALGGGSVQFVGAAPVDPSPAIQLHNGQSVVAGPLGLGGTPTAIRPVFSVGEHASLRFTEHATVPAGLVTKFKGQVVAQGGSTVGQLEGSGTLDVAPGSTNAGVMLGSASLEDAKLNFIQANDGLFPALASNLPIDVMSTRIRTIANPHADQEAVPLQQELLAPATVFGGPHNRYDPGRINRGSAWVPSRLQDGRLVADRRVLARREPAPGDVRPPYRAKISAHGSTPIGTDVVCKPGEYNHAIRSDFELGTFYRDGVEIAQHVPYYTLTGADVGHEITCASLVEDEYGNQIDDPAAGHANAVHPEVLHPEPHPETPANPEKPSTPAPETPAKPVAPAAVATTPAAPAATAGAPRAARTVAAPVPAIAATASTPARCPTVAELADVSTAWKLAATSKSQTTLTGNATPGIWRCSATGVENGQPVVVRSLPVLVANKQRAMLTSESAQTPKLRNPTLMSSGTQRISARLYARGGDAKLKTRTTRFTQTVRKGANTLRFTQTVGSDLPKGRYKLVVRAITRDGVSAPLVQEVTIK